MWEPGTVGEIREGDSWASPGETEVVLLFLAAYLSHPQGLYPVPLPRGVPSSYLLFIFPRGTFLIQEIIVLLSLFKCLRWLTRLSGTDS